MKKKVTIDISSSIPNPDGSIFGIGRTTLELASQIDKFDLPFKVEYLLQRLKIFNYTHSFNKNIKYLPIPRYDYLSKKIRKSFLFKKYLNTDLFHIPTNFGYTPFPEKTILTIHDTIFFILNERFEDYEFLRNELPKFAQKCKAIITCSYSSKNDIIKYLGVQSEKIHVTYWGYKKEVFKFYSDKNFVEQNLKTYLKIQNPFFLSVSCDVGRKNSPFLIKAFIKFAQNFKKHSLVLVTAWKTAPVEIMNEIVNSGLQDNIIFLQNLSDEHLAFLYNGATAFFYPSLYEGFGLPILESIACGTVVVTHTNSSLPEIANDAAIYIQENNMEELINIFEEFERTPNLKNEFKEKCLKQAELFSWEKCAKQTIEIYEKYL